MEKLLRLTRTLILGSGRNHIARFHTNFIAACHCKFTSCFIPDSNPIGFKSYVVPSAVTRTLPTFTAAAVVSPNGTLDAGGDRDRLLDV